MKTFKEFINEESFEIDKSAHKKVQKKAKLRNLAKGNTNPNEKAAAEKKAGGPKLVGEEGAPTNATGTAVSGTGDDNSTVVIKPKKKKKPTPIGRYRTRVAWKKG